MLSDCESPFSVSSASFDQWDGRVAAAGCYEDLFERLRQLDLPNASSKGKFAAPVPDEQSGHNLVSELERGFPRLDKRK